MTTFGCRNLSSSFSGSYDCDTKSKTTTSSSSKAAASAAAELVLRGGRVVNRGSVGQKKSKKVKRGAPAQRAVAAAKAVHRKRLLALQQLYNKQENNIEEQEDLEKRARVRYNYVYVANLVPGYTEKDIRQVFEKTCGQVLSVSIRLAGGKGITIGTRIPEAVRGLDDTNYALVVFAHSRSALKALQMTKMTLHGSPLIITQKISELPEWKRAVLRAFPPESPESPESPEPPESPPTPGPCHGDTDCEDDDEGEATPRGLSRTRSLAPRPIPLEPTELLDGPPTTNARFIGISFQADLL